MYVRLLVSVLFLTATASATYVISVDNFIKEIRNAPVTPRSFFDSEGFLNGHGYPFESHKVTTEDGYILSLHRIPHGKNETVSAQQDKTKPAVLIMHGILASSVEFFILGPERSLPLMLADLGYDVWLGNNRGNTWSRKHTTLDPDENATYWDYSFHEHGMYDVPAIIDYILNETGQEMISYIGHSQGSTQFFVTTSMRPEYNDKINVMAALGPAVFIQNMTNPLFQTLKNLYELVDMGLDFLNVTEFLPFTTLSATLQVICDDDSGLQEVCASFLFFLGGFDSDQLNRTILPIILQDIPAGSSAKTVKHFLQEIKSGHFRPFDYGEEVNLEVYNASVPQDYNLGEVVAPVGLYYAENDWMVGLPDIDRLTKSLPNVVETQLVKYRQFNHFDFLFATDVVSLVYVDVINLINLYNGLGPVTPPTGRPTPSHTTTISPITGSQNTDSGSTNDDSTVPSTTPSSAPAVFKVIQGLVCGFILMFGIKLLL